MLDHDLESKEELFILDDGISTILGENVLVQVSTHVQKHLPDILWKEFSPASLCISVPILLVMLLPSYMIKKRVDD